MFYCAECEHFNPIISAGGAYKCYKRDIYLDVPSGHIENCKYFQQTKIPLSEKEKKVWM